MEWICVQSDCILYKSGSFFSWFHYILVNYIVIII